MVSKNLDSVIFTFLDVETTGLDVRSGDRICEIALLRCRGDEDLDSYQTLVNPGRPISPGAQAVNHITDAMVADAPIFEAIAPRALELVEGAVLVAHNASFDISFINSQLSLIGLPKLTNRVVDTLTIARRQYRFPSNSLGDIRRYLKLPQREEHRAMGDILTLRDLFMRMVSDLRNRGTDTLEGLMNAQVNRLQMDPRPDIVIPPLITEALEKGRRLKIKYLSGGYHESERVIMPLKVEARSGAIYIIALCYLSDEKRTFRLDRIKEMEIYDSPDP